MALLASKSQYAPSSHNYGPGMMSHQAGPVYQPSASIASPAGSDFLDGTDMLDEIRSWDERRVGEWLRSINCGKYNHVFEKNNITGETLLECSQAVLKEMGVTKVGDRVRISVAVKNLRTKAFGNPRGRNRDTIASLDQLTNAYRASSANDYFYKSTLAQTTPRVLTPPSGRGGSRVTEYSGPSLSSATYDSPTVAEYPRPYRADLASPPLDARLGSGYFSNGGATTTRKPVHASVNSLTVRHNPSPSLDGIMSLDTVWQNCVKMIGTEGSTRIVTISDCNNAEQILRRALKKFNIYEDWSNYCVYTVEDSVAVCLSDSDLVRICLHEISRPERGRLILRRKGSPPSATEIRVAQEIAREHAVNVNMSTKPSKIAKILGETPGDLGTSSASNSPVGKENMNPTGPKNSRPPKKLTAFFGQRPPSELISSNLAEYFPGHERGVLEETVRNSIRRSTRMSRYQSRLSVATTKSFASTLSDAPPVPSVGEAWLNASAAPVLSPLRFQRPMSIRKSVLLPSTSFSMDDPLGTLPEEGATLIGSDSSTSSSSKRKSYMSIQSSGMRDSDSISVVVTDTDPASNTYLDENSVLNTPMTEVDLTGHHILDEFGDEDDDEDDEGFMESYDKGVPKWIKGQLIGAGSFGSVYLALNAHTGELMAVKQVELSSSSGAAEARKKSMLEALEREILLLRELQHPNIVQYLASGEGDGHFNIFLEYVPGGSVAAMLNSYGPLPEPLVRNFVRQILTGLAYLHGRNIIHRDIKGANILVDNKGGIKISDFGISKKVDAGLLSSGNHRPSLQGSVFWMAPEVVKQTSYTRKADIWSLGCLVVEMFTGNHPYPDCSQLQAIFKIGSAFAAPQIPSKTTPEAKAFLSQTFEIDHNKRPSADELLSNPFMVPMIGTQSD